MKNVTNTLLIAVLASLLFVCCKYKGEKESERVMMFTDLAEASKYPEDVIGLFLRERGYKEFPKEILKMKNLKYLDLSFHEMTEIPPKISNLSKLEALNLSEGLLVKLPPEIAKLKNLSDLNLNYNNLISLPPEIGELENLYSLGVCGNELTALPDEICQLQSLQKLCIRIEEDDDNSTLSEEQIKKIKSCLNSKCKIWF